MSYEQTLSADRRLLILKALASANGYSASAMLLQAFLQSFGHSVSHDLVAGELAWLAEQGLVGLLENGIATLTQRGLDVSKGAAQTPGVRRPAPGER
jgi:hypothetical protein